MVRKSQLPGGFAWISVSVCLAVSTCLLGAWAYLHHGPSEQEIANGKVLFEHEYTVNDPLCGEGDGLGPVFNERSCVACHFQGGVGGAGPNGKNVVTFEVFPVPGRPEVVAGGVHAFATNKNDYESVDILAEMYPAIPDAVQRPSGCSVQSEPFDPVQVEEISTPALFGLAAIEKISSASLALHSTKRSFGKIGREFEGKFDGTGIGRLRNLGSAGVGKFGWKGQFASIEAFVANACAMELGLTNRLVAQPVPNEFSSDEMAKPDMSRQQLYELVAFVKSLPAPRQVIPSDPALAQWVHAGEELFISVGCADCHVPDIGGVEGVYSDFHLYEVEHDDVPETYLEPDFSPEFTLPFNHPRPSEWKTPPLWGVADSAPYFHDGGSPTLTAAILRHGRDGRYSREQFQQLPEQDKRALIAFLRSLRAPMLD